MKNISKKLEKELFEDSSSSYLFLGFTILGIAFDLHYKTSPVGILTGIGIGFIATFLSSLIKKK